MASSTIGRTENSCFAVLTTLFMQYVFKLNTWIKSNLQWLLASIISSVFFTPLQAENIEFTEAEQAWIEAHPVIKVGGETDWAPFDFVNEQGQYAGDFQ